MYINKKHIKVIPLLICFFYSFFNNSYLFSQNIEKDTINSDTLKTKLILDDVRRKAKEFVDKGVEKISQNNSYEPEGESITEYPASRTYG